MKENGEMVFGKVSGNKNGLTVPITRENGLRINLMEKDD